MPRTAVPAAARPGRVRAAPRKCLPAAPVQGSCRTSGNYPTSGVPQPSDGLDGDQGLSVIVPFISVEWPGNLQTHESGPAPSCNTGKVTQVDSPPPTHLRWATNR